MAVKSTQPLTFKKSFFKIIFQDMTPTEDMVCLLWRLTTDFSIVTQIGAKTQPHVEFQALIVVSQP